MTISPRCRRTARASTRYVRDALPQIQEQIAEDAAPAELQAVLVDAPAHGGHGQRADGIAGDRRSGGGRSTAAPRCW